MSGDKAAFRPPCFKMATVIALVRGISQIIAAAIGLLLIYGVIYAMEGMTSRLPMSTARELVTSTVFMLPWTLLFSSGFHDLSKAARRGWVFWAGNVLVLGFLYYFNRYTTNAGLTKAAMPILACAAATVPHVLRRTAFIYPALCVLFALCGVVVFYYDIQTFVTPGRSFATPAITAFMVTFPLACIIAGALSIASFFRRAHSAAA